MLKSAKTDQRVCLCWVELLVRRQKNEVCEYASQRLRQIQNHETTVLFALQAFNNSLDCGGPCSQNFKRLHQLDGDGMICWQLGVDLLRGHNVCLKVCDNIFGELFQFARKDFKSHLKSFLLQYGQEAFGDV